MTPGTQASDDIFEDTYTAGVYFDPEELRVDRATVEPWRELARRAVPREAIALGGELLTPDGPRKGYLLIADSKMEITTGRPQGALVKETDGVILPGLLDLHNHPEFNVFAPWEPPKVFANRYRWRDSEIYQALIRDVQNRLLKTLPRRTQTRYAEIRALVGGVTAIQGASGKDRSREEALVRNVDLQIFGERRARAMVDLPSEGSRDLDRLQTILGLIDAGEVSAFYLHLAEGRSDDRVSVAEFERLLELKALTQATVIIHGTALGPAQFGDVRDSGAKLVWSPQSNLRLYGETTNIAEALRLGVPTGLGADWLPSGSTTLLGELKVARRALRAQGYEVPARKLVEMVTSDAAAIAGLGDRLGSLEDGRPADVLVLERRHEDPWETVADAHPDSVELVTIDGDLAYGRSDWITEFVSGTDLSSFERLLAWGKEMLLDTSYAVEPTEGPKPKLADLRSALVKEYPQVGPIFA